MSEDVKTERKGGMTVAEAGRKGGLKVRDTHGLDFYQRIGKKGGDKVKALHPDHYQRIGQMGGRACATKGSAYYSEIGTKGGQKVKEMIQRGKDAMAEKDAQVPPPPDED